MIENSSHPNEMEYYFPKMAIIICNFWAQQNKVEKLKDVCQKVQNILLEKDNKMGTYLCVCWATYIWGLFGFANEAFKCFQSLRGKHFYQFSQGNVFRFDGIDLGNITSDFISFYIWIMKDQNNDFHDNRNDQYEMLSILASGNNKIITDIILKLAKQKTLLISQQLTPIGNWYNDLKKENSTNAIKFVKELISIMEKNEPSNHEKISRLKNWLPKEHSSDCQIF
jgi:hypothetical protein